MNLGELFQQLSFGEFQNLSFSNNGDGTIATKVKPRILGYTNAGLLVIYKQFVLREKDIMIEMVEGITNYHFKKRFAQSNEDECECNKYILDMNGEPFEEDVIRILAVHDSRGYSLPLNDARQKSSVFTPQANILQVPWVRPGQGLSVHYQARHPILTGDEDEELMLPMSLEPALKAYVAYKVFSDMSQSAEASAKAQEHYAMFQAEVADVLDKDTSQTSYTDTSVRFFRGGWI